MNANARSGSLFLLWVGLLLGPASWMGALGTMLALLRSTCSSGDPAPIAAIGLASTVLAVAAVALGFALGPHGRADREQEPHRRAFMRRLAIGMGLVFALVNLLTTVPVLVLSPCPH